mgnify:CR=1 FL=1
MILGENIRLRAIERTDIPCFVRWMNDPEVTQSLLMSSPLSAAMEVCHLVVHDCPASEHNDILVRETATLGSFPKALATFSHCTTLLILPPQ